MRDVGRGVIWNVVRDVDRDVRDAIRAVRDVGREVRDVGMG